MSDRRMQSTRDDRRRDRDDGDRDRRRLSRSRSPAHRGGGRRDDREPDPYSSHRGYREREREDRYGRGGGRGDWDRDRRGGRREGERRRDDRRRDFDDRHDRRGGGRGDDRDGRGRRDDHRRDREDERQLEHQGRRGASRSPARKQKEPTPDLTDFTEIGERTRRLTQWDIKPQGYEKISAEQAKISGMFPLPGAPRPQGQQDPSKNQALALGNAAAPSALKAASARKSKQLFVYNIPPSTTVESITGFFNLQLNGLNVTRGVDPCISASIGPDHSYALLEFKTPEDATTAMAFDGIHMEEPGMANNESNGDSTKGLDIQRPKDYIVPNVTDETENEAGVLSGIVSDSQNKISITNIPIYLTDTQIQELLVSFGELKNFVLVKDISSDESRGIAFCEYKDADSATAVAVESLNGMELGNSLLKVQRASIGIKQVGSEMTTTALRMMAGTAPGGDTDAGRVICLINMITPQELMDKDEADEILEDVQGECAKYGQILEVKMPRPQGPSRQSDGVGKIYIKYADSASAQKALAALAGRRFADRTVVVMFYGEEYFDVNSW